MNIVRRKFVVIPASVLVSRALSGCGSGSSSSQATTPIGQPLNSTVLLKNPNGVTTSSSSTQFAPGISLGGVVVSKQSDLQTIYAQPSVTGAMPTVDFSKQTVICYTVYSGSGDVSISHVSSQQVIVRRLVNCGVGSGLSASLFVLIVLVDGVVQPTASIATDLVC